MPARGKIIIMTAKTKKGKSKGKRSTFKCKFCGETKPLEVMTVQTTYFPPVVACRDCEKNIR